MFEFLGHRWKHSHIGLLVSYLALLDSTTAVTYDNNLSFGHVTPISHDGNHIPSFHIVGEPRIFSDRILLTPPVPGSQRSAIWAENLNKHSEWTLEVPFRASGPERAGGSFHIWYTQKGSEMGAGTVYNSKPFDGMALVIDSFGGRGGSLRGFLNDGSTDYSLHHNPQSLSFGHCDLHYRNLGVITTIKVSYSTSAGLKVQTDDKTCFETKKVKIPENYHFGISAASADNPDSFEIFGFKVSAGDRKHYTPGGHHDPQAAQQRQEEKKNEKKEPQHHEKNAHADHVSKPPDQTGEQKFEFKDADVKGFKSSEQQFSDLHERLQALTHQIAELQRIGGTLMWKLDQLGDNVQTVQQSDPLHAIELLEHKINALDHSLQTIEQTLHDQHSAIVPKVEGLHDALGDHQTHMYKAIPDSLKQALHHSGPKIGTGVTVLILFQVALVAAYIVYKRRRSNAPKKFL